ncbi:MAG: dihydrolipoyl dehydrogenase [Armatimonadaceae bacterium]
MRDVWDVVVIGGGPAGVTAALRARELGAEVVLVERGKLGGTCTNDGCVPTRVWAKAARLLRDAEQFPLYGLDGSVPRLDFARLQEQTRKTVEKIHAKKQIVAHLEEAEITVLQHAGDTRFTDAHSVKLANGEMVRGKKFIICAGGRARRLDFPGNDLALVPTEVWNLTELPRSVVIVGAAATGCQLASILNTFGAEVTLLEVAPRILPGEDETVSQVMAEALEARGIAIRVGMDSVSRIERFGEDKTAPGEFRVTFSMEGQPTTLCADTVVTATGWPGNGDRLGLDAAGVAMERGYITVDDTLQTSVTHIFAAGDITGRMMLVQSAYDGARIAAENAVREVSRPDTHRIVPHGGFTDPEYGSVGKTEEDARQENEHDVLTAVVPYADLDRAVIDGRTTGLCKLVISRSTRAILGAHVVGEQALEVVQVVASGMASGMTVDRLAGLELAYPTFTGILGLAARQLCREIGIICRAPDRGGLDHPRATEWEHRADSGEREVSVNPA